MSFKERMKKKMREESDEDEDYPEEGSAWDDLARILKIQESKREDAREALKEFVYECLEKKEGGGGLAIMIGKKK